MKNSAILLTLASMTALAHQHDDGSGPHEHVINQASELLVWCKAEAQARYVAKNITPYQWTASHYEDGNALRIEGKLRVHGDDVAVRCRIARGAREQHATIEIDDPEL